MRRAPGEPPPTLRVDDADGPHPAVLRLCRVIRAIPAGRVCTYGALAAAMGWPSHSRLVGRFLSESDLATELPWHRVVGAGGTIRSRRGAGPNQQKSRLEAEGGVFVTSKDQTAKGDAASFDMNKEIMVMTGREVVLSQGPNVVVGNKLTVNLKTGQANLTAAKGQLSGSEGGGGRVKVRILPNSVEEN